MSNHPKRKSLISACLSQDFSNIILAKQHHNMESQVRPKPGGFLPTLILINGTAISFATLLLIFRQDITRALGNFPSWFNLFLVIFLFARLAALTAIWKMKRRGVYAFLLLECIEAAMGLFVFSSVFTFRLRLMTAIPTLLVLIGIWYFVLKNKWRFFT